MPAREEQKSGPRGRQRAKRSQRSSPVELLGHPLFIGATLGLAGVLTLLVVVLEPLGVQASWSMPRSEPQTARAVGALILLGVGGLVARLLRGFSPTWKYSEKAHRQDTLEEGSSRGSTKGALVGACLFGLGSLLLVFSWLGAHQNVPAGKLLLPANQAQQAYHVKQGHREVKVMLPLRMTLQAVEFGDEPRAMIRFARPGQQSSPQEFWPGRSLDVEGYRFVFAGFARGEGALRAVMTSAEEDSIPAAGVVGDTLRFQLEGPRFTIVDALENYLEALGPAVKLERENGEQFWVFQRTFEKGPDFGHPLRLERLEQVPAALIIITPVRATWPLGAGLLLLLSGLLLLLLRTDERFLKTSETNYRFSLNRASKSGVFGIHVEIWRDLLVSLFLAGVTLLGFAWLSGGLPDLGQVLHPQIALLFGPALCFAVMVVLLFVAGVKGEGEKLKGFTSAGAFTALGTSILAIGSQRGGAHGFVAGAPVSAGSEPVYWHIPGATSLADLKIPAVVGVTSSAVFATLIIAGALIALVVGAKSKWGIIGGYGLSFTGAVAGLFALRSDAPVFLYQTSSYEALARPFLQSRQMAQGIADQGVFSAEHELTIHEAMLLPEIVAYGAALFLATALLCWGHFSAGRAKKKEETSGPLEGRDAFMYALLFGTLGWAFGLAATYQRVGSAGIQTPMEWLGLAMLLFTASLLLAGWRGGSSPLEGVLRRIGPALALIVVITLSLAGTVGGLLPAMSLPLLF